MLQRIQSLYLFLVFVFALLFATLPLASFPAVSGDVSLRLFNSQSFFDVANVSGGWLGIALLVMCILVLLLTTYIVFQYGRRLLQIKMARLNVFLHVAMVLLSFIYLDGIRSQVDDAGFSYGPGIIFPLVSLILILMAMKAIRKDENLVRSADRIR